MAKLQVHRIVKRIRGRRSPGAMKDNQIVTQNDTKPQESSNIHEWSISIFDNKRDKPRKPRIQRIPSLLREKQSNKNCYDPLVVSIGPYHHGKPQLEAFEKLKIPIAKKFVCDCGDEETKKKLYDEVAEVVKIASEYYEEGSIKVKDDKLFNEMLFLDACFVLHFMSIFSEPDKEDPLWPWSCYFPFVLRDLLLLENQIPFILLKVLMKFRFESVRKQKKLIQNFLHQKVTIMPPQENSCTRAVTKFLAQTMGLVLRKKKKWKLDMVATPIHLLHLVREQLIGSSSEDNKKEMFIKWHTRSVTELVSAGIHFRPSQTYHVTDVNFKSHLISSTLTLPPIMVDDSTKSLLLNLAAYEMCPHGPSDYRIMSYICLMDSFIDHADDVKELRKRRILVNELGSDDELAQLFNEMGNELVCDLWEYEDVTRGIENHCKSKVQVWMAEWMHNHFSSPWALLAFLGAIFALALTAVQTYFAVFPRQTSGNKTS